MSKLFYYLLAYKSLLLRKLCTSYIYKIDESRHHRQLDKLYKIKWIIIIRDSDRANGCIYIDFLEPPGIVNTIWNLYITKPLICLS